MEYELAFDLQEQMVKIVEKLGLDHIDTDRVSCIRSRGSQTRRVLARVHGLPKALQLGMNTDAFYVIEFLEAFEKNSKREKLETIIHELLHIPRSFGGGFRHHNYVRSRKVKRLYERYITSNSNRPHSRRR